MESSDLRQPVSRSNSEAIPEEETYAIPPTTNAASGPQPKAKASNAPGTKFVAMSKIPADFLSLNALARSGAEYSNPSNSSSKIAPICAPIARKSELRLTKPKPPWPTASPTIRYKGTTENFSRAAMKAITPSPTNSAPISARVCDASGEPPMAITGLITLLLFHTLLSPS